MTLIKAPGISSGRKILPLLLLLIWLASGVSGQVIRPVTGRRPPIQLEQVPRSAYLPGKILVKFSPLAGQVLPAKPLADSRGVVRFNIPAIDALNRFYKINRSARVYEQILHDPRQAARHHAWGLDRWYELDCPAGQDVPALVRAFARLGNLVEAVEPVYKIERYKSVAPLHPDRLDFVPNDTLFGKQWDFNNTGQQGGTPGKDIQAVPAWDIASGDSNVIVGVFDGGIQINHPDIAAHMWWGKGFNFVTNSSNLDADEHGTHTAGTIGAINNNGTGVSGIAGGNGSAASGVRLMSLEIFGPNSSASDVGAAYVWAADHGAAIAQNSWGYTQPDVYQQSVLDGIDYFTANGGGKVMKGGLVIFAAGNSNSNGNFYPGYYDRVIAVAATNNKDVRSYYSNYGNYVDISAPGGEQSYLNDPQGILSTTFNSGYEFLQGTSMACPHVSGVAALIISVAPGRFSADDVRSILLQTTDDIYPLNSSTYAGQLGTGRVNAYKALQLAQQLASRPVVQAPANFAVTMNCPDIQLSWTPNAASDEVMIAASYDGRFGIPLGNHAVGDSLSGGTVVVYKGTGSLAALPVPADSTLIYYRIWSVSAAGDYSYGQTVQIRTPFSIAGFSGTESGSQVLLSWTPQCPFGNVLVARSNTAQFGIPQGNLQAGQSIAGGGTVLYKGSASGAVDSFPQLGTNYYRIWPARTDSSFSPYYLDATACYGSIQAPVNEGFESNLFPPAGWRISNPDAADTWERTSAGHASGSFSATLRCYSYSGVGAQDYLLSPPIDATLSDSVYLSFARAYRQYDNNFADTLEVVVSTDCGAHFTSVWKKGGAELSTVLGTLTTSEYFPIPADWKQLKLDLKPFIGNASSFIAGFRSTNEFGQDIYIDEVNISVVRNPGTDARVSRILSPESRVCDQTFDPVLELANSGKDTLRSVRIYFRADQLPMDSIQWSGSLAFGQYDTLRLSDYGKSFLAGAYGPHQLLAFTRLPNGLPDDQPANDSASVSFILLQPRTTPLQESFESVNFPDNDWTLTSSGHDYSWERTTLAASDRQASVWIRNYRFSSQGGHDDLYSPLVQLASPDSVYLNFDVANAPAYYPGSTSIPLDTLEVLLTTDCGQTLHSVYKKWGQALTSTDPNFPPTYDPADTIGFIPKPNQWRKEWIDLTPWLQAGSRFQVIFRNTSNKGNNTYIDRVNFSTVTLPQRLKEKGYQISPNPFNGYFVIRHVVPPVHLVGLQVSNSLGQVLFRRSFQGNAASNIYVNMAQYARGMYEVKLIYDNKVITERIIKQ